MLAQQIITKPIFEKLFAKDGFAMQNAVSQTIDEMLQEIDAKKGLEDINKDLEEFYGSVENTLSMIDTADGKQKVITALYEKFFKNAFPKDQSINGVVYTPQEIVDFIIRSAADALKEEFDIDINDENSEHPRSVHRYGYVHCQTDGNGHHHEGEPRKEVS